MWFINTITNLVGKDLKELKTEYVTQVLKFDSLILLNNAEIEQIKYWKLLKLGM